jgi:hypothetical protein
MPARLLAWLLLMPALAAQDAAVKTARGEATEATSPLGPNAPPLKSLDAAAARGLKWLADQQLGSGCWTGVVGHKQNHDYYQLDVAMPLDQQRMQEHGHIGVTALCGMAFLAGGHLPDRGPYAEVVRRTIAYVMSHSCENGYVTDSGTRMYSHAFATLFLAEAYGMAGGPDVKLALERATQLITDTQNQYGGWRYNPFDREVDLSVTVCQVQALRAARNIGIRVPVQTIDRAVAYVQRSRTTRGRDKGLYYYKIVGRGAYEKNTEYAINAAAVTALNSAGIYDPEQVDTALDFLLREYGGVADYWHDHFYYWYGNYYACQAFFQTGGERFQRYYATLARDLLAMQRADGRWVDRVGPGDEFSTAIACMLLQLPKQYLPIFQR